MREIVKRYAKDGVTVVWQPGLCVHSQVCFHGLPSVFDPRKRPWVNMDGSDAAAIVEQVKRCPSGALSLADPALPGEPLEPAPVRVTASPNGPYEVRGDVEIVLPDGQTERKTSCALCRCGHSGNKPYCDRTHAKVGFQG